MNTPTEQQLKQALAKMLPAKVYMNTNGGQMHHRLDGEPQPKVLDTELLHLCWLVEHRLQAPEAHQYGFILDEQSTSRFVMVHATWQQRTTALAKVLGVEIV